VSVAVEFEGGRRISGYLEYWGFFFEGIWEFRSRVLEEEKIWKRENFERD